MRVDALALRLRPRTPIEAADAGGRLCQVAARSVYSCYAVVALPVMAFALASFEVATWLPSILIWCSKPWMDRTILFVLSRAAFGQRTTPVDIWREQRHVWWSQFVFTWTVQRLSLWRALTQPVYQLEGHSVFKARARIRQIRRRNAGSAFLVTQAFFTAEAALTFGMASLVLWFAPSGQAPDLLEFFTGQGAGLFLPAGTIAYVVAVFFLEPFYVAAGFSMYLNRRAELEGWDIEQEFRRVFAA